MELVPDDVIGIIRSYVPIKQLYVVNKSYFYSCYPRIIENYSLKDAIFNSYIKRIIRKDCELQFRLISRQFYHSWVKPSKWVFNYSKYPNYAVFIKEYCNINNSQKCKNIISATINDTNSCNKNKYKKIKTFNTKWSN
jgi:hypothetical protein